MIKNRELLEIQNSVLSLTVGCVFIADYLLDGDLYGRFPDTYQFMKFLPSVAWGLVYATAGVVHLASMLSHYLSGVRKEILLIKSGLWLFLGWCVVYADAYAASGWCYLIFSIFAVISFFRFNKENPHYGLASQGENPLV